MLEAVSTSSSTPSVGHEDFTKGQVEGFADCNLPEDMYIRQGADRC